MKCENGQCGVIPGLVEAGIATGDDWTYVEDAEMLAWFQMFTLVDVDENGEEHDLFEITFRKPPKLNLEAEKRERMNNPASAERKARVEKMRHFYELLELKQETKANDPVNDHLPPLWAYEGN